ncbi:MAG: FAD-dependent oxidoreductase [Acidobacteriales bacterium]|nr:FAD-dependent oxidoreductase [Terriglobales bacterium]
MRAVARSSACRAWRCAPVTEAHVSCDVLVVGGGPAGLTAAQVACESGAKTILLDDNPAFGGQIWRGAKHFRFDNKVLDLISDQTAAQLGTTDEPARLRKMPGWRVVAAPRPGVATAESLSETNSIHFQKLILATGARERFLPFPGWTLPNVMGAGGLQAMVKSGLPIAGKRVVIAGTGPLLLAVAEYLKQCRADVRLIAEQASGSSLFRFGLSLTSHPAKLFQAAMLKARLLTVPYLTDCWVTRAEGKDTLERVCLRQESKSWQLECDYLATGFHLIPNTELAELMGCAIENGCVKVDEDQQTSVPNVYCAGEPTGIGGVEKSVVEGRIAGLAAAGLAQEARKYHAVWRHCARFAGRLNETFRLREELKALSTDETFVCRCEDVTLAQLRECSTWRAAKLHRRCGMGPCQGRICGPAVEFLFGWKPESVRPPVFPARVESLTQADVEEKSS